MSRTQLNSLTSPTNLWPPFSFANIERAAITKLCNLVTSNIQILENYSHIVSEHRYIIDRENTLPISILDSFVHSSTISMDNLQIIEAEEKVVYGQNRGLIRVLPFTIDNLHITNFGQNICLANLEGINNNQKISIGVLGGIISEQHILYSYYSQVLLEVPFNQENIAHLKLSSIMPISYNLGIKSINNFDVEVLRRISSTQEVNFCQLCTIRSDETFNIDWFVRPDSYDWWWNIPSMPTVWVLGSRK